MAKKIVAAKNQKKPASGNRSIQEITPFKCLVRGNVLKSNGKYLSLLKVTTRNINGLSYEEQHRVMSQFDYLLRIYDGELSILAMMFPTNIDENMTYWNKQAMKARQENNKERFQTIRDQINRLIWVEKELSNLEFYFMIYGQTEKEINLAKIVLKRAGGTTLGIKDIPPQQIEKILYKLNNLNTPI